MPAGGWRAAIENVLLDLLAVVVGVQFGLWGGSDWLGRFVLLTVVVFAVVGWWRSWQAFVPAAFFGAGAMVWTVLPLTRGTVASRPYWEAQVSPGLLVLAALAGAGLGVLARRPTRSGRGESLAVLAARRRRLGFWLMTGGAAFLVLPVLVAMAEYCPQGPCVLSLVALLVGWPIGLLLVVLGAVMRWFR